MAPLAAFSVLDEQFSIGLAARVGRGIKHDANPLFSQEKPWETRIDNGYASVFFDPTDSLGAWRLWYTSFTECASDRRDDKDRWVDCGSGARSFAMLYANSSDGVHWQKPELDSDFCYVPGQHTREHHFDCNRTGAMKTNIAFPNVIGSGMLKDHQEPNASKRWKILGGNVVPGGGGVCASTDGLHFANSDCIAWPNIAHMHWDSWWNMFWRASADGGEYIATGRADTGNPSGSDANPCGSHQYGELFPACLGPCNPKRGKCPPTPGAPNCSFADCYRASRAVSRVQTHGSDLRTMGYKFGNQPVETAPGPNEQLYVQATFPYLNVWLGVVMVYNAATFRQEVHCRLVWSNDTEHYYPIDDPGVDLIPLGPEGSFESHICYGSRPVVDPGTGTIREYYFGGDGPHYGVRNSSLALIEFRPHGIAGIGGAAGWSAPVRGRTKLLNVSGSKLVVSADTAIVNTEHAGVGYVVPDAYVKLSTVTEQPIVCKLGNRNVTEEALSDCDLTPLQGEAAAFDIEISGGALLYTMSFL